MNLLESMCKSWVTLHNYTPNIREYKQWIINHTNKVLTKKVNEEQAKAIPAQILQGWEELTKKGKALIIQKEQMEAYAQDVINRYELGKKSLDIEEQKLVKDIVLGMLEIASKGAGSALGAKVGKTGFQ